MSSPITKMNLLMSVVVIVVLVASVHAQSACKTPEGEPGTCVPIRDCNTIIDLLRVIPVPLSQKSLDYIKSSHCGAQNNMHYVCCSPGNVTTSNTTPIPTVNVIYKENAENNQKQVQKDETGGGQNMNIEVNNIDGHSNLKPIPLTQNGRIQINIFIS